MKDKIRNILSKNVVKIAEGIVNYDTIIGIKHDVLNFITDEIYNVCKEAETSKNTVLNMSNSISRICSNCAFHTIDNYTNALYNKHICNVDSMNKVSITSPDNYSCNKHCFYNEI